MSYADIGPVIRYTVIGKMMPLVGILGAQGRDEILVCNDKAQNHGFFIEGLSLLEDDSGLCTLDVISTPDALQILEKLMERHRLVACIHIHLPILA